MRWGALGLLGLGLLGLAMPASAVDSPGSPPRTVVSFTFDDGWATQVQAADVLATRAMPATFYVPSGSIGQPGNMTLAELKHVQAVGHQIAGHTVNHLRLTTLTPDEVKSEVCDDRAVLERLGFPVTDFAYPYGDLDTAVARVVEECGYNSARQASGLYEGGTECSLCPITENIPPTDDRWKLRTTEAIGRADTLDHLKSLVMRAEAEGGWLPIVFHEFCEDECEELAIPLAEFTAFVDWVADRPNTTVVQTVHQVVGGKIQPVVGSPQEDTTSQQDTLSRASAFTVLGYDVGQLQVIFGGIAIALVGVVSFRLTSRKKRYVGR